VFKLTRAVPVFVGSVLGAPSILPQKVGAFADSLLGSHSLVVLRLKRVIDRSQLPTSIHLDLGAQFLCCGFGGYFRRCSGLRGLLLGARRRSGRVSVFDRHWKHTQDVVAVIQYIHEAFFHEYDVSIDCGWADLKVLMLSSELGQCHL
jgi:hypothetical protein